MTKAAKETNEFSFFLKPSSHGVGVFAAHDIAKDTYLCLFEEGDDIELRSMERKKKEVPPEFRDYCMDRGEVLICPKDFRCMHVGWYLNHSSNSNTYHKDYKWYARRDIKAGEEITIDYNSLEEPEAAKDEYYFE